MSSHIAVGAGLVVGMLLWLAGGKIARTLVVLAFSAAGSFSGILLAPWLGVPDLGPVSAPTAGLIAGGTAGLVIGVLLYRLGMAVCMAFVAGTLGLLAAGVYIQNFSAADEPAARVVSDSVASIRDRVAGGSGSDDPGSPPGEPPAGAGDSLAPPPDADAAANPTESEAWAEAVRSAADRARAFCEQAAEDVRTGWAALSPRHRLLIASTAIAGAIGGFLIGLAVPKRAAAVVTAPAGAALWLASGTWLVHAMALPGSGLLDRSWLTWSIIWGVVSGLGLVIQFFGLLRRSKKAP